MRTYLAILFAVVLFTVPWVAFNYPEQAQTVVSEIENAAGQLASAILSHNPRTVGDIRDNYQSRNIFGIENKKVRILLVPGHEPGYGGAEFGSVKERQLTVKLSKYLQQFLQANGRYDIFVTRDDDNWNPIFAEYWKTSWNDIVEWQKLHRAEMADMTRLGSYKPSAPTVFHNNAPLNVALRLFGIDKWANDNRIDIVVHIHFNDYPGHGGGIPGKYSGFAIYVPDKQYFNSTTTRVLAEDVERRLEKYNPVSDLPGESQGIVEDQDLIAVGSNNSVDAASMLIEYGYIYEKPFTDPSLQDSALEDLAFQTYLGLQDFLDPKSAVSLTSLYDTLLVPYKWDDKATLDGRSHRDIFALQTALLLDGDYPPEKSSMNDCPRSGLIGACTKAALDGFQKKYGIDGEQGTAGPKTIQKLNEIYGMKAI